MCGRFVVARSAEELVDALGVDQVGPDLPPPSFNVAPTAQAAIVLDSAKTEPATRRLESARWGLVPPWAKDPSIGVKAFNARSEEVEAKPMFRSALVSRRAVVPTSGYYEWKTTPEGKTPHYIHPADDEPLFLAGLYEWWKNPSPAGDESPWLLSFTVLTRDASGPLGSIHDRMPLFLDSDFADAWLDPHTDNVGDLLDAAIDAAPDLAQTLVAPVVSRDVGNVRNDSPALLDPIA